MHAQIIFYSLWMCVSNISVCVFYIFSIYIYIDLLE